MLLNMTASKSFSAEASNIAMSLLTTTSYAPVFSPIISRAALPRLILPCTNPSHR